MSRTARCSQSPLPIVYHPVEGTRQTWAMSHDVSVQVKSVRTRMPRLAMKRPEMYTRYTSQHAAHHGAPMSANSGLRDAIANTMKKACSRPAQTSTVATELAVGGRRWSWSD